MMFEACRVEGCDRLASSGISGMCRFHAKQASVRRYQTGEISEVPRRTKYRRITEEVLVEYLRRVNRFESPQAVCRDLGMNYGSIRGALRKRETKT